MAKGKDPKNGKGKSEDQTNRLTLRIRNELIDELEGLADNEGLDLGTYIGEFLKHKVGVKKARQRELEQFLESQKGVPSRKIRALPTITRRIVANPQISPPPDPFQYPNTDIARAMIKRVVRQQVIPESWGYGRVTLLDSEGLTHFILDRPEFINPLAEKGVLPMKPMWKILSREGGDVFMSALRLALQGHPFNRSSSFEVDGRLLNLEKRVFDLGKGLAACVIKTWWDHDSRSVKLPTESDRLSRYFVLKKRLQPSDPQSVWWVQSSGLITDYRSQFEVTSDFPFSGVRLMHMDEIFDAESLTKIMDRIHMVLQTREKDSFTMEETFENLSIVSSYTIYPLNHPWPKEGDTVMMTKKLIASTAGTLQRYVRLNWATAS